MCVFVFVCACISIYRHFSPNLSFLTHTLSQGTNKVAVGYDEGVAVIKLGSEEPPVSMDSRWENQDVCGCLWNFGNFYSFIC